MIDPEPRPDESTEPIQETPGSGDVVEPATVGEMPLQPGEPPAAPPPVEPAQTPLPPVEPPPVQPLPPTSPPVQGAGAPPPRRTWLWWVIGGCAVLLLCCMCSGVLGTSAAFLAPNGPFRRSGLPAAPPRQTQPQRPSSEIEPSPSAAPGESPATGGAAAPSGNPTTGSATPANGSPALDFTLKTVDGQEVRLSDFRGRPVIVNFWATWCGPCQVEMPLLSKAVEQNQDKGLVVLAVDQMEPASVVQPWIQNKKFPFTVVLDSTGQIGQSYRVRAYPTTYFVDPDGVVKSWQVGSLTQFTLDRHLSKLFE
ncbi:MAG: redoxin domain-containing protein [Anaerolineae bacterium]